MRVMRVCVATAMLCACLVLVPAEALAQASITGVVRDTSGGVLPGVTVEAVSPALIEKVRSVVTDGNGQYRIVDLRPGAYSVTYSLSGFNKFKRDGIELEGSFTATVNVELPSGTLEETVTVSGETPIVDTQSVTQQRVLDKEILDAIPAGRNHANYAALIPGMNGAVDYGGTNNLVLSTLTVHGSRQGDQRVLVDGMSTSATSGNGELSNFIPDITSTEEVAVSYAAGSAEQAFGGVQMNLIPREGGNSFKGSLFATGVTRRWQGSNYTTGTAGRRSALAEHHQAGLRREPGHWRSHPRGPAVVLRVCPLAVDGDLPGRRVGERERRRPDTLGLRPGLLASRRCSRSSRRAATDA